MTGMIYTPAFSIVPSRFLRLIRFCWRRKIRLGVHATPGWCTGWGKDGVGHIWVQPREIETDSSEGFMFFAHELGHILFSMPKWLTRKSRRWYRKGTTPLGFVLVLLDEFKAWVVGFFLLWVLRIPVPRNYIPYACTALQIYISGWRKARETRRAYTLPWLLD